MKTEIEKKIEQLNKSKAPIVAIDPSLNKYKGKVLFPKKLAIAEEKLNGLKLPQIKKHLS
jgi:NAD(P)H-hydrate repair Nnr-like enzyme with NAD(P)H-hydrate epimerase domain